MTCPGRSYQSLPYPARLLRDRGDTVRVNPLEDDLLRGEAERLADAARRYAVETHLTIWPRVWHAWHVFAPQLPEATQALKALAQAVRQRVDS